jgi:hypothetical protein
MKSGLDRVDLVGKASKGDEDPPPALGDPAVVASRAVEPVGCKIGIIYQ